MIKLKRKVHVISRQESYLNIIAYQLLEILGDKIELSALTIQQLTMNIITEQDIVVLSKETLKGITRPFIPDSCPVIVANREVNIIGTKELLKLPKGRQILVINDTVERAEETAISLENIYFEHEYIAYDLMQSIPSDMDVIVTPGEMGLVPKQFENVIDIGPRTLDFKTILKIANLLNEGSDRYALMNRFIKSQLSLAEGLYAKQNFHYEKSLMKQDSEQLSENTRTDSEMTLSEKEIILIINKIEEHGFLEESMEILEIYKEGKKNFESFGRTKVKLKLRENGIHLTDQQLRLRMEVLQYLGLINARQGRGGAKISDKGEDFLKYHKDFAIKNLSGLYREINY
ncbi:winged-helix domain-containing protein [Psychrobacillus sp. FJAT-51614]|uniref:Winged-helix domain-containing protein n=1 Tax=Psychrobacillus mangrovi TaxID=3117745 RepID=A0ABU8F265_9BACI